MSQVEILDIDEQVSIDADDVIEVQKANGISKRMQWQNVSVNAHSHPTSEITGLDAALAGKEPSLGFTPEDAADKDQANGYAGLDGSSKIAGAQVPYGAAANTACEGDDARLSDDRTPLDDSVTTAKVTANAITFAKFQQVGPNSLLGNYQFGGAADVAEVPLATDPEIDAGTVTNLRAFAPRSLKRAVEKHGGLANNTWKIPVTVASTANIVNLLGETTIDGVVTSDTRVLLKDQTDATLNGIWITNSGAWNRPDDFSVDPQGQNATMFVQEGATNGGKAFTVSNIGNIVIGTTALTIVEFGAGGSGSQTPWVTPIDAAGKALNNFGYLESLNASPADDGMVRLGTDEEIFWRNNANSANIGITSDVNDDFVFSTGFANINLNSNPLTNIVIPEAITFADGVTQTFNPDVTNVGVSVGQVASDPTAVLNGGIWYNSTDNKFKCFENGAAVDLIPDVAPSGFLDVTLSPYNVVMNNSSIDSWSKIQDALDDAKTGLDTNSGIMGVFIPAGNVYTSKPLLLHTETQLLGRRTKLHPYSTFDFTKTWAQQQTDINVARGTSYTLNSNATAYTCALMTGLSNLDAIHGLGRYFVNQMVFDCDNMASSTGASFTFQQNGTWETVKFEGHVKHGLVFLGGQQHDFIGDTMFIGASIAGGAENHIHMDFDTKFMYFKSVNWEKCGGDMYTRGSGQITNINFGDMHVEASAGLYPNAKVFGNLPNNGTCSTLWVSMGGSNQIVLNTSSTGGFFEINNTYVNNQDGSVRILEDTGRGHTILAGVANTGLEGYQRNLQKMTLVGKDASFPDHGSAWSVFMSEGRYMKFGAAQTFDALISLKTASSQTAGLIEFIDENDNPVTRIGPTCDVEYTLDNGSSWSKYLKQMNGQLLCVIDRKNSIISTGFKGVVPIPFKCTPVRWEIHAPLQIGSIVFDIAKTNFANAPPAFPADSICGSNKPSLSAAQKSSQDTILGWDFDWEEGDVLAVNVDTVSLLTNVTLAVKVKRIQV